MQFVKMHGAGNDFVLVDLLNPQSAIQDSQPDWSELARQVCDRHFGIGSDGLLLVLPSASADARMRMFNPDGSESASCGNGIRCLGRYVRDRYGLGDPALHVETGAGPTTITVRKDGLVTVDMGRPIFNAADIPTTIIGDDALDVTLSLDGERIPVSCVSMGNPHAVTFVEPGILDAYPLDSIGPRVEHHPLFPQRTNFEVCEVLAPDHMRVRVWERGAGITLACGTGACAAAVVGAMTGRIQPPVRIDLPGGQLEIDWNREGAVFMTGPAKYVFTGTWSTPIPTLLRVESPAPHQRMLVTAEASIVG
ncbi:MAG: diaminopimelate epimerase [Chloroflexi bacterium]|nr:diaminopimelate epimerase [Chloroflexota bacterium]